MLPRFLKKYSLTNRKSCVKMDDALLWCYVPVRQYYSSFSRQMQVFSVLALRMGKIKSRGDNVNG